MTRPPRRRRAGSPRPSTPGDVVVTREERDAFAARSHQRAAAAQKNGLIDDELVPVSLPQRKGNPVVVTADEGVREDTTTETLAGLRPSFSSAGTITAAPLSRSPTVPPRSS